MSAKVVLYSKDPCPYCVNAKRLLQNRSIAYEEIDLTENIDELIKLKNQTGHSTVPMIFIGEKFIGGYTDLRDLADSGELDKLLQE